MRNIFIAITLLLGLTACQKSEEPATPTAVETAAANSTDTTEMAEPRAEKRPHELTLHGITRVDDYYWLRDDERSDPEVLAYLESENEWFDTAMAPTEKLQETLYEEMVGRLDPGRFQRALRERRLVVLLPLRTRQGLRDLRPAQGQHGRRQKKFCWMATSARKGTNFTASATWR